MKLPIHSLQAVLTEPIALFVGMASFEDRCRSIFREIGKRCETALLFKNDQSGDKALSNLLSMVESSPLKTSIKALTLDDPIATAGALQEVCELDKVATPGCIFVDITTFTHEQLLILLRILENSKTKREIIFGYTGADKYSTNTNPEDAWLTRGVSQVRSVLGFPGNLLPSKKLHLMVLVGFEYDRAKAVIEAYEPSILTLGIGEQSQSVSDAHFLTNQRFFDDVRKFVDRRATLDAAVRTFSFSCIDPLATKSAVLTELNQLSSHNTVICPMNTKLSTLGVALAVTEHPESQICYSRAIEYNELGYSTASDQVTLFRMNFQLP